MFAKVLYCDNDESAINVQSRCKLEESKCLKFKIRMFKLNNEEKIRYCKKSETDMACCTVTVSC